MNHPRYDRWKLWLLPIITAVLAALKLAGLLDITWYWVFIPLLMFVVFAVGIVLILLHFTRKKNK